jgi:hypothetical protein
MSVSTPAATTPPDAAPDAGPAVSSWLRTGGVVLLLTAALSVLLTAFAWPAARSSVHDVPLAIAGPAPVVKALQDGLNRERPGAFAVRTLPDEAAALAAIRDREVYGALVVGSATPKLLLASAAGPAVAQGLTQLAQAIGPQLTRTAAAAPAVVVQDVVASPADDPRGAGLAAGALPLVIGGIATAGVLVQLLRGASRRLVAALGVAALGGLAMTGILHGWLGSLTGSVAAEWGAVTLAFAATSITLLGLEWLLGPAGLGLGAAVMLLLGNPLSGLTSAPEMLPGSWGAFGQLLPPGALGTLLRSVAFFDGARAGGPVLVLACWLAFGLALCLLAALRSRGPGR